MNLPAGQWTLLEAVAFGLGILMLIAGGAAVVVLAIAGLRDRRPWRCLLVFLSIHWLIGVVVQYVSWLALVQSGWDVLEFTGMQVLVSFLVPMDLVVLPAWVLLLAHGRVGRSALTALIINCLVFLGLFAALRGVLLPGGVSALLSAVNIFQSSGLYVIALVWGMYQLLRRRRPDERPYAVLLGVLLVSFSLNSALYAAPASDLRLWYLPIILLLPFIVALGLGMPALQELRRMALALQSARRMYDESLRVPDSFLADYRLSRREGEVAQQLLQAGTTSEIADRLFISEPTVNTHIRNIYRKCDVHSRAQFLGLVNRSIAGSLGLDATLGGHLSSSASQQTVVSS